MHPQRVTVWCGFRYGGIIGPFIGPIIIIIRRYEIKGAIHGIEAQTIENVLKNWVDRMGYCTLKLL